MTTSALFSNARAYRLTAPFSHTAADLEAACAAYPACPCGPQQQFTLGWAPALGGTTTALVRAANGALLLCLRRHERQRPAAAAVTLEANRQADQIEATEQRTLTRREYRDLSEDVATRLLASAPIVPHDTRLLIDPAAGWLVAAANSANQAEVAVSMLRLTLGTLPAKPLSPRHPPRQVLTRWLTGGQHCPADIVPLDTCELRDPHDGACVIRAKGVDLDSAEIRGHLEAGLEVSKLALVWDARLECVLTDDLSIRRLTYGDADAAVLADCEDDTDRLDAEMYLSAGLLRAFLARLDVLFGLTTEKSA
jgi:recombination associated protein RdgC